MMAAAQRQIFFFRFDELRDAIKEAWAALPESVVLNAFRHLPSVHAGIVARKGGNKATRGT